jgi:hypothetical protein
VNRRYTFAGPDGVPVVAELLSDVKRLYPGSGEEPPDYAVTSRLFVNDRPVDPLRYPALVNFLEEYGR